MSVYGVTGGKVVLTPRTMQVHRSTQIAVVCEATHATCVPLYLDHRTRRNPVVTRQGGVAQVWIYVRREFENVEFEVLNRDARDLL